MRGSKGAVVKKKLNRKEIQQLQKTHTSMLTWLVGKQKSSPICKVQEEIEDMEWENKDKEEKLERVKRKQLEWVSSKLCRSVLIEIMNESVEEVENWHVIEIVNSMVVKA